MDDEYGTSATWTSTTPLCLSIILSKGLAAVSWWQMSDFGMFTYSPNVVSRQFSFVRHCNKYLRQPMSSAFYFVEFVDFFGAGGWSGRRRQETYRKFERILKIVMFSNHSNGTMSFIQCYEYNPKHPSSCPSTSQSPPPSLSLSSPHMCPLAMCVPSPPLNVAPLCPKTVWSGLSSLQLSTQGPLPPSPYSLSKA